MGQWRSESVAFDTVPPSVLDRVQNAFIHNYGLRPDEVLTESTYRGLCHLRRSGRETKEPKILTDLHVIVGYIRSFPARFPAIERDALMADLSKPQRYSFWQYDPFPSPIREEDVDVAHQYVSANQIRKRLGQVANSPVTPANRFFSAVASVIQAFEDGDEDHFDRYVELHFNLLPEHFTIPEAIAFLRSLHRI